MPVCWIIAGPNGAGKTTFALEYLPQIAGCRHFINADLIAAGLSPLAPEAELAAASRLFFSEIEAAIQRGKDFGLETTLSGRSYLRLIHRLRNLGWTVELVYLALPDAEMSELRVAERVAHGGHEIPIQDIKRRFPRSLKNLLGEFGRTTTRTRCFMNSGQVPSLVFEQSGDHLIIHNDADYRLLQHHSQS
jgi:predicted ABC-type ATPase